MALPQPGPVSGFFWMLLVCTLWSTAGVVSRQLESAVSFEVTFWRSFFCGVALILILARRQGLSVLYSQVVSMGYYGWLSGACWSVMFTCFMVAITLTSVTNTLLIMSLGPLFAAFLARWLLGTRISLATWLSIGIAGLGLWWMFHEGLTGQGLWGVIIALGTPIASAFNLIVLRKAPDEVSLIPAIMLGAFLSAAVMLPFIFPIQASVTDLAWLGFLGVFQLAVPCSLLVWLARFLPPQELALLALLEVVLGPIWAWLWGGEVITVVTLQGAAIILSAVVLNTVMKQRADRVSVG